MPLFSDPSVGIADPLLRRAYIVADRGRGTVSPNPLVGCVVARDGRVVAEGHHARAGGPHAEVVALDAAGPGARGADVYVTLEPCDHHGRTPPCTERLLAEGVASVTIGMRDPDTSVSGGGAERLAAGGVRVRFADDPGPFRAQNEAWLTRLVHRRPFVRVKAALTLDARPALSAGTRSAITSSGGRDVTMRLRAESTAIMVGAGTVDVDDPILTARGPLEEHAARTPRRYVLARTSLPAPGARVFQTPPECAAVIASDAADPDALETLRNAGVRVIGYPADGGILAALEALAADGVDDVLVEPGPRLMTALVESEVIDELVTITAGGLGGDEAPAWYTGPITGAAERLAPLFVPIESGIVGTDVVTVWRTVVGSPSGIGKGSALRCSLV